MWLRPLYKWLFGLLIATGFVVVLLLLVPFVIDMNQFKPQIREMISQKANVSVDFESARFTILGGLGVKLTKVSMVNTDERFAGMKIFTAETAFFRSDFKPLLKGELVGLLEIDRPEVTVVLVETPKLSVIPQVPSGSSPAPLKESSAKRLPDFLNSISIRELRIINANVVVHSGSSAGEKAPLKISNLNIIGNLSPFDAELSLNFKMSQKSLKDIPISASLKYKDRALAFDFLGNEIMGGQGHLAGTAMLDTAPIDYKFVAEFQEIRLEQLLDLVQTEHAELVKGSLSMQIEGDGKGMTSSAFEKTLNAKGNISLHDAEFHSRGLVEIALQEFGKFSADFDQLRGVDLTNLLPSDKKMKDVNGRIEVKEGRLYLVVKNNSVDGTIDFDGSVGFDMTLAGTAIWVASDSMKQKLRAQNKYASLLFDEKGELALRMEVGGTVSNPSMKIDFSPLRDRLLRNASLVIEKKLLKTLEDELNSDLKAKLDSFAAKLKRKLFKGVK